MTEYFTPNDLIRYIYQETNEVENEKMVQALDNDDSLMQDYLDLLSTLDQLDHLILQPSDHVVKAIKIRSKSSGLEKV